MVRKSQICDGVSCLKYTVIRTKAIVVLVSFSLQWTIDNQY